MLPPGDIRNCLVALAEDEQLLTRLFNYRFSSGHGLRGHNLGNLFLTALTKTGVAVCGAGVIEPLAGRTESFGSRN